MITVTWSRSSAISSSMRAVAIGSSAEVGSSNSRISGLVASARAMHRRCCWPPESESPELSSRSLTSSQIAARRSACLDFFLDPHVRAHAADAQAIRHVLEDGLRERIRLLEHHADPHPHLDRVDALRDQVEVVRVQHDLALVARAGRQVVHAVEAAQERRLAAARGADQRRHALLADLDVEALRAPAPCRNRRRGSRARDFMTVPVSDAGTLPGLDGRARRREPAVDRVRRRSPGVAAPSGAPDPVCMVAHQLILLRKR